MEKQLEKIIRDQFVDKAYLDSGKSYMGVEDTVEKLKLLFSSLTEQMIPEEQYERDLDNVNLVSVGFNQAISQMKENRTKLLK